MIRWNEVEKLATDCDFSETALSMVAWHMGQKNDSPRLAIFAQSAEPYVQEVCEKMGVDWIALPDAVMKQDCWAVAGKHSIVWSGGA